MSGKIEPGNLLVQEKIKSKSSNAEYDVYIFDNCVVCTCPAGGKKQLCKHIISLVHKNFDMLKTQYPDFFALLMHVIEVKENAEISQTDKIKEYAKVIFLNRDIVNESRDNLIKSTGKEIPLSEQAFLKMAETLSDGARQELQEILLRKFNDFPSPLRKNESMQELLDKGFIKEALTEQDFEEFNKNELEMFCHDFDIRLESEHPKGVLIKKIVNAVKNGQKVNNRSCIALVISISDNKNNEILQNHEVFIPQTVFKSKTAKAIYKFLGIEVK